jgi:FAD/FMN-containing dehydrogenase
MRLFRDFNPITGELTCSGGTSLEEVLRHFSPLGWFPPVVPGTKFVTIGGAIANDIHGKNHHSAGTFGRHISSLTLLRSDRPAPIPCSPTKNKELYEATIGGLGLTGIILQATFQLKRISSSWLNTKSVPFSSIDEFFTLESEAQQHSPYTVAWVDLCAKGSSAGRGIHMSGDFLTNDEVNVYRKTLAGRGSLPHKTAGSLPVPPIPFNLLSKESVSLFNWGYRNWNSLRKKSQGVLQHYNPFFFPLDSLKGWNSVYGPNGFFQYQSVVPLANGAESTKEMIRCVSSANAGSFLSVMKTFGKIQSPGLLSFPTEGFTLAMDFPNRGEKTLQLLKRLDEIVTAAGGRLYPAKDARMSKELFQNQYPNWKAIEALRDPRINSAFWERTTGK